MTAPAATEVPVNRFEGDGIPFKGKLIGMEDLKIDRDEKVCLDSMFTLKTVAAARREHKQKIQLNLTLSGVKVYDDVSKVLIASHEVERISFVVLDPRDNRAFGYVYNTSDDRHQFWAIKSERAAAATVLALKELFELAFEEFTKTEKAKIKGDQPAVTPASSVPVPVPAQEQSLFSTSIPSTPSTLLSSPPPAVPQPAAATMPLVDDIWGSGLTTATPVPAQSPQPTSPQVNELDLWGAPEPVKPPAVQDSLDDMFGAFATMATPPPPTPVVPTLPPPPAVPRLPPMPAFPAMPPPRPTVPIVPPPVSNVGNNDIMSMFSPAAPMPAASNAMFAQPTPQPPVIPQQPPQPSLLMATPAPAFVPPAAAKPLAEFDLLGDFA